MSDQIGSASIGLSVDSSGVDAGLARIDANVQQAGRSLQSLGQRGAQAVDQLSSASTTSASRVEASTRSIANSIQRTTALTQAGERGTRAYFEALANQRGANLDVLRPYLDQLDQVRARQAATTQELARSGNAYQATAQSAGQLANNLRQVPAQLTDIVVGLQSGQRPLSVLLQQGGQLRDMFGSVGGAARALGGYVASLVNPFTITTAAVGALALAYQQGSAETDAFRKAIVTTGNAAGVTTSQLTAMARQAAEVSGTVGKNAEVIAQLVGTGQVSSENLAKFSAIAVQSQKLLGVAVEDTVKAYADLGKDPLQATLKLNEQYNYLTLATYQQIKALEQQGRTAEAAKVAQNAYADAQAANNKKIAEGLGTLERGWMGVTGAAKSAWDAMLNVGRETTIEDKIKAAVAALKKAQRDLIVNQTGGTQGERQAVVDQKQADLDRLQNIKKVAEITAQYAAEDKKRTDAAIKFNEQETQYLSQRERMEREIVAARNLAQQAAQRGEDPAVTEQRVQDRIAKIRQTYADLDNQRINAQIANIERLGAVQAEQAKRAVIALQGRQEAGLNVGLDKQAAYAQAIADADIKQINAEKARLQQRLALVAQETVSIDGQFEHEQKLADLRGQIAVKDQQVLTRRAELQKDLFVQDVQDYHRLAEAFNQTYDARLADVQALKDQVQAQQDQNGAIGLTGQALRDYNAQLAEQKAAYYDLKAAIAASIPGREDEAALYERIAQGVRDLNTAQQQGQNKQELFARYDELFNSIDQSAKAAFVSMGDSGVSAAKRIQDALKSGVLSLIYDLTAKPILVNLKASLTGTGQTPEQLAADQFYNQTGYKANGNSLLGQASNALGLYRTVSGTGAALTTAGNFIGSSTLSAFGAGLSGGASTAEAAAAYAAAGESTIATALSSGATIGSFVSTALPYVAAAFIGYKVLSSAFDKGPEKNTTLTFGSNNQAGNISINMRGNEGKSDAYIAGSGTSALGTFGVTQTFWSKAESQQVQDFIKTVSQTDDALAGFLTTTEKAAAKTALTGLTTTVNTGAENSNQNAAGQLDYVFKQRIQTILGAVEPGLDKLVADFAGTSTQLAQQAQGILQFREALAQSGETVFGVKTTLVDIAALKLPTEAAADALKRVTSEFQATNAFAQVLGKSYKDAFGTIGLASEETRKNLISAAGGLDKFNSLTASFAQNFLTEAEKLQPEVDDVNRVFASLNLAVPATKEEFKALVRSIDPTTEAGQKLIASLLGIQQEFADTHQEVDATTNTLAKQKEQRQLYIELLQAQGKAEEALAAQRADAIDALLSDQAKLTQARIYAAQAAKQNADNLVSAADATLGRLSTSINAEKQSISAAYQAQEAAARAATQAAVESAQASLQAAQQQAQAIQTVFDSLNSALGQTKIESAGAERARRQLAQAQLQSALSTGNLAGNTDLAGAISTISGQANARFFGTFQEYVRDQARTNNSLVALRDKAGAQVDYQKQVVDSLQESIKAIQTAGDAQIAQLEADKQAQLDALDRTYQTQKEQIDALKGINDSVLSLKDALAATVGAISAAKGAQAAAGSIGASGADTGNPIQNLYQSILGRTGQQFEIDFWTQQLAKGTTLGQVTNEFLNSEEFKRKLRGYAVGSNYIGKDQVAMVHEGERIFTAVQNQQIIDMMQQLSSPQANASTLAAEVARLSEVIAAQQLVLDTIASNTGAAAGALTDAAGGRPLNVKVKT